MRGVARHDRSRYLCVFIIPACSEWLLHFCFAVFSFNLANLVMSINNSGGRPKTFPERNDRRVEQYTQAFLKRLNSKQVLSILHFIKTNPRLAMRGIERERQTCNNFPFFPFILTKDSLKDSLNSASDAATYSSRSLPPPLPPPPQI